jgi:RHS repeat-associated protein
MWRHCADFSDVVRIQHGYDRLGNRLWRHDLVAAAAGQKMDELYTYDPMSQLLGLQRGQLNDLDNSLLSGSSTFREGWALDAMGNWSQYEQAGTGGAWDLAQTRTHNAANEITAIAATTGSAWLTPAYDLAGNTTLVPASPHSLVGEWSDVSRLSCVYDAWNRLVRVSDATSGETLAEYQYDGRNFRTVKCTYAGGDLSEVRHFYYSSQWQVLEERVCSTLSADPGSLAPSAQYVWGLRYIDDLILRDRDAAGSSASAGDSNSSGSGALGERLYALQDPNWNVVAAADVTGAIVERYSYSAYGEPAFLTAAYAAIPSSSYDMDVLYCGYRWDADLGSYLVRNRTLWPHLGRWERRDPVKYLSTDMNLYRYAGNSTIARTDEDGLQAGAPGTGICMGKPRGVVFVPGRGTFSSVTLGPYGSGSEDWMERVGSGFSCRWTPNAAAFADRNGCPCCKQVGIVQVVAAAATWMFKEVSMPVEWEVDGGIPYPKGQQTTVDPMSLGAMIMTNDSPSAQVYAIWGLGRKLHYLWQRFETCAVCLRGNEADKNYRGLTVYGCVSWEHHVWRPADSPNYYYRRELAGLVATGDSDSVAPPTFGPAAGAANTQNFSAAVQAYLGGQEMYNTTPLMW